MKDAGGVSPDFGVFFIGSAVIEEVELDHLHPLEFEIEQRSRDPSFIRSDPRGISEQGHLRFRATRRVVISPIDPQTRSFPDGLFAATVVRRLFRHLSKESFAPVGGDIEIKRRTTGGCKEEGSQQYRSGQCVHWTHHF